MDKGSNERGGGPLDLTLHQDGKGTVEGGWILPGDPEWIRESAYLERVLNALGHALGGRKAAATRRGTEVNAATSWLGGASHDNPWDFAQRIALLREAEQGAAREEEVARRLTRQRESPYFGRVDFRETAPEASDHMDPFYIGVGVVEDVERRLLVHDWRSPVASLYYEAEGAVGSYDAPAGPVRGEVGGRRQYVAKNGSLMRASAVDVHLGDELLRERLVEARDAHMHNIVATIQREQNRAIRAPVHSNLVVEGPAGSGKTAVALQRLAYLLYRQQGRLRASRMAAVVPSRLFGDYVSRVLPELGEENPMALVFDEWVAESLPGHAVESIMAFVEAGLHAGSLETALRRFKASRGYLDWLRARTEELSASGLVFRDWGPPGIVWLPAEQWRSWCYETFRRYPMAMRREEMAHAARRAVRARIPEWVRDAMDRMAETVPPLERDGLARRVRAEGDEWRRRVERDAMALAVVDWPATYGDAWRRSPPAGFSSESAPPPVPTPFPFQDAVGIFWMRDQLAAAARFPGVLHVLVDEFEDYGAVQLSLLRSLFPAARFTLVGDPSQASTPHVGGDPAADALILLQGEGPRTESGAVVRLKKAYRSPPGVMTFALQLLHPHEVEDVSAETLGREARPPAAVQLAEDRAVRVLQVRDIIQTEKASGRQRAALVTTTCHEAAAWGDALAQDGWRVALSPSNGLPEGPVVLPWHLAKGLEFDVVLAAGFDRLARSGGDGWRRPLYVASTRTLGGLYLLYGGEWPEPWEAMRLSSSRS